MVRELLPALRLSLATLALTGIAYPLALTGAARALFPGPAEGSLLSLPDGRLLGSALIAQPFRSAAYFHPRPSAGGYDGTASGGSNLGPTSARLRDRVRAEAERLRRENPDAPGPVPAELVTASGSGLDPHLGPEAAAWQAARVAAARGLEREEVEALVAVHVEPRTLGLFGEPRVNVLLLNLDLDRRFGPPRASPAPGPGRPVREVRPEARRAPSRPDHDAPAGVRRGGLSG